MAGVVYIYIFFFHLENPSSEMRSLKARIKCNSVYYTGETANLISEGEGEFQLEPGQSKYEKSTKLCFTMLLGCIICVL